MKRRTLLGRAGAAGAFIALSDVLPTAAGRAEAQTGRAAARDPLETLTQAEFDTLEAIGARLIPTDANGPGAVEAGAARYIDRALGGALASFRETYRDGLEGMNVRALALKAVPFTQLSQADQDAVLTSVESEPFFALVLAHTVQGTFGDPFYGGNRNFAGWDLIGYPGVRLAVTAEQQNLDAKTTPTHMSAYDYTMFSGRKPARGH